MPAFYPKEELIPILLLLFTLLFGAGCGSNNKKPIQEPIKEPVFSYEGTAHILKQGSLDTLATLAIEFAISDAEQQQGLMFRKSMEEKQGMLFIFEAEEKRFFWMRNTYLSLDILYLNKDLEIITIHEQVIPLYDGRIPSLKPAQYVLEVVGGFCESYQVVEGDKIRYQRLSSDA